MTADAPDPNPALGIRPYLHSPLAPDPGEDTGPSGMPPMRRTPQDLRPFVLTSGRVVGVDPAIGLETQVTARTHGPPWTSAPLARLSPEMQGIVGLCGEPMSVAEISARLGLHLGVTKILVGDLRAAGHLDVHLSRAEDSLDADIILRVIDGLRAIS